MHLRPPRLKTLQDEMVDVERKMKGDEPKAYRIQLEKD